ncbi:hypothetical protein Tco_0758191, partial [Tanacetum coccineum]
ITALVPYARLNGISPLLVLDYALVSSFYRPICLRMIYRCGDKFYSQFLCSRFKWVIDQLGSVVRYDGGWHSKPADNVIKGQNFDLFTCYASDWLGFQPFGKIINGYYQIFYSAWSFWERFNNVHSLLSKGPSRYDGDHVIF